MSGSQSHLMAQEHGGENPMWITCDRCGFAWVAMYLPMPIRTAAECMKRCYCPKCGNTRPKIGGGTGAVKNVKSRRAATRKIPYNY